MPVARPLPDARSPDGRLPMPAGIRRAERFVVLSVVLFVAALALAAVWLGGETMLARVLALSPGLIAGLLGLSVANYVARAVRWHLFCRRIGLHVPWLRSLVYYVAGFSMTVTPGKLGEALRLWLLRRGHGYSYERTAGLLVADRLNDAGAMALLATLGLFSFGAYAWTALAAAALIAAITLLFLRPMLLLALTEFAYARIGRWPRPFARVRIALRHLGRLASWRLYGGTLVLAWLGWLAEAGAFHWLLVSLGAKIAPDRAVSVFALSMLAGALVILPGGLGGTEATMVGLLVASGVPVDVAVSATAVIRVTTLWFGVGLGFTALPVALRQVSGAPRP
jgi:uncharacterized membrane protein YbhN (UPF0104 family)